MRRVVALLLASLVLAALAACGLEIVGSMNDATLPVDGGTEGLPGAPRDGASGDAEALPDDLSDGGVEEPIGDAGLVQTDCGAAVIADNFNDEIGLGWSKTGDVAHVKTGGTGYVRLTPTGQGGRRSGLFFTPTVVASSFKVTFRYYAQRPAKGWFDDPYYGDGLTFVWLTSGNLADLGTGSSGQGLGVPNKMGGAAFALDSYDNSGIGDPSPPSFSLLRLDPARGNPGSYDWHIKNRGPYSNLYDTWREVSVTYANGMLSANVSTTNIFQNEPVAAAGNIIAIGFTAATGGADAVGYFIDTARVELTNATCPQ